MFNVLSTRVTGGFHDGLTAKSSLPLHPSGPNPYVPGAQRLHFLPTTFGLHEHIPPSESQMALVDPVGSHWHAEHDRR